MHDTILHVVVTPHASLLTEATMLTLGPLVAALLGILVLAGLVRSILFDTVDESSAGLDRRFLVAPPPADALESHRAAKILASRHR
jgi:hypothetical protein